MTNKKFLFVYILMPVSVLVVFLFPLVIGSNGISFVDAVKALFGGADSNVTIIIRQIRFPRIIMACVSVARPETKAAAAPKAAPLEMPKVRGSASGFLNTA